MKKILIPVMLGLLCSPVFAEPTLHDFAREIGYSEAFLNEGLPGARKTKSDAVLTRAPIKSQNVVHSEPRPDLMDASDLLHPRVFQKGESPAMIPVLTRLHRQNPRSDKITRKLAVTCLRNGQPREALYWYIQTYQRERSDFESLWNMASIAYRLGEMDQAKKYLEEYSALDPNSAWGRMARDFLSGSFSGNNLSDGFKSGFGRTVISSGNKIDDRTRVLREQAILAGESDGRSGSAIMVIEGKRTDFDSFMSKMDKSETLKPNKKNGTLEGKTRAKASTVNEGSKSSLEKARIVEKPVVSASPTVASALPVASESAPISTASSPVVP